MKDGTTIAVLRAMTTSKSLTEAAQKAGVSRPTCYKLLKDKHFRAELQRMRECAALEDAQRLAEAKQQAIDALCAIVADDEAPQGSRVFAAKAILAQEAEAQARVDALITSHDFEASWT